MLSRTHRVATCVLSIALVMSSPVGVMSASAADPVEEARELYAEGVARFETFDFDGAIDLWTKALAKVPVSEDGFVIRSLLSYNIATAQLEAYKLDLKVDRLKRVLLMLQKYEKDYVQYVAEGPEREAELQKIQERRAEVEKLLDEASGSTTAPPPDGGQTEPGPEKTPAEPDDQDDQAAGPVGDEPRPKDNARERGPGRPLLISGGVVMGLGVAGLGAMGAGMALGASARDDFEAATGPEDEGLRLDLLDDGKRANTIAIAGGVAGGVLLATGAVLVALGAKKNASTKNASSGRRPSATAAFGRDGVVLGLRGRF